MAKAASLKSSSSWIPQPRTIASTTPHSSMTDIFHPFFAPLSTNLPCLSNSNDCTTTTSSSTDTARIIDDASSSDVPQYEFQYWPLSTSSAAPGSLFMRAASTTARSATGRRVAGGNPLLATTAARLSNLEARWFASTIASASPFASFLAITNNNVTVPTTASPFGMSGSNNNHRFSPPPTALDVDKPSSEFLLEQNSVFIAVLVALYIVEFIIGFLGNLAVVIVIARQVNMHNVTNFFIANMAIADILLYVPPKINFYAHKMLVSEEANIDVIQLLYSATLSLPITPHFTLTGEWSFGRWLCHIMPFIQGAAFFACTLTLMNIAIDRWRNVCQPLQPRMNHRTCAFIIGMIWLFSALVCLPYGVLMKIDDTSGHCVEDWPTTAETRIVFGTSVLVVQYVIPLLVISICYILIWFRLKERPRFTSASGERERRESERQNRLQTMLTLMVVFFAISWLPMNAVNLTFDLYSMLQPENHLPYANAIFLVSHAIAMSSICYNPILYAGLNETFRAGLRQLLGFSPSSPNTSIGGDQLPPPSCAAGGGGRQRQPSADHRSGLLNQQQSYPLLTPPMKSGNTLAVGHTHNYSMQTNGSVVKQQAQQHNTSGFEGSNSSVNANTTRFGNNANHHELQNNITVLAHQASLTKKMPLKQLPRHRELTTTTTMGDSPVVVHHSKPPQQMLHQQTSDGSEQIQLLPLSSSSNGSSANSAAAGAHNSAKRVYSVASSGVEVKSPPSPSNHTTNAAAPKQHQNAFRLTPSTSHPVRLSSSSSPLASSSNSTLRSGAERHDSSVK